MNFARVLLSELRKLFFAASLQPARVHPAREWLDRTRCW
jgi:hypothetical protein